MALLINNLGGSAETVSADRAEASPLECKTLHTMSPEADSRPHILYIIDALCVMGGTERVLLNMIRLLPKDRFRCSLLTFKIDERAVRTADIDCPFHLLPLKKTYDWNAVKMAYRTSQLIRKQRVGIVHTFFETSDLWAGPIARLSGCPVLISSRRDLGISRSLKHSVGYKLLRNMYDSVLAVSPQVREFCIEQDGVKPSKTRTLFNGVDAEAVVAVECRDAARGQLGVSKSTPVIITVANIRRVKGLDILVEAARLVCQRYPEARFLIAGQELEAEYSQQLQTRIALLGLQKNFTFLGARADVFRLLGISDVFCLPSRSEGFSNALIEAMAAGLPAVVTDVGGSREVLQDRETGFIVDSEDSRALAQRLISLLDDPARAVAMGQRAQAIARSKFTVQGMMDELVEVYEGLLAARGYAPCMARS
jgi:glycosyltransferase involved in cell wall biosynthesis